MGSCPDTDIDPEKHKYYCHSRCIKFMIIVNFPCVLQFTLSPITPMSDQDRISPYNINTISTR